MSFLNNLKSSVTNYICRHPYLFGGMMMSIIVATIKSYKKENKV